MKNFKKLIKESYLGNPLNEVKITPVSGTKAGVTYSLDSDRKLVLKKDVEGARIGDYVDVTLPKGTIIYNLPGGVLAAHESLKDLATSSNPYIEKDNYSGIRIIKSRDTLAAIENAANLEESLPGGFHSKEDLDQFLKDMKDDNASFSDEFLDQMMKDQIEHDEETLRRERGLEEKLNENKFDIAAKDEYGKPFAELSLKQKQELISYMNRETEKEFETDYTKRKKGELNDKYDGMTDYQRGRMDGEIKAVKEDINDPVLVKTRAAQMKRDKIEADEKDKKSYLDKKYGSSFMDKLEAEIDLKNELQNLEKEREDVLMRIEDIGFETEQTAEPEGGEKANDLADRLMTAEKELRAIDNKIIDVKDELGHFRMYESVNEDALKDAIEKEMEDNKSKFKTSFPTRDLRQILNTENPKDLPNSAKKVLDKLKKKYKINKSVKEETDTDVGGGAKPPIGLDIDDAHSGDAALDNAVKDMGYNESKGFNFKQMIKESLIPKNLR